jgi:4-amino-4-deoxy-L-arabinose transferase-like glycosyltransferase
MVAPLLGSGILLLMRRIGQHVVGDNAADVAVVLVTLSPVFLAQCVGRLSHGLAGVLVAGATLACLEGVRTRKMGWLAAMFGLLVLTFHVRPFTALLVAVVLGLWMLWALRRDRVALKQAWVLAGLGVVVSAGSVLAYNWVMTGLPLLSPYALQRGAAVPVEVSATIGNVVNNLQSTWRFAAQSETVFSFPFLFPLAAAGFWWALKPGGEEPWLVAGLPVAIILGHLVQPESSASAIGERYWFEGYFALAILAGSAVVRLTAGWRPGRAYPAAVAVGLVLAQAAVLAGAVVHLDQRTEARRKVTALARRYEHCQCVVFLSNNRPAFVGSHLNLNAAEWRKAAVFYAVDPGPAERAGTAASLGRQGWIVLTYDKIAHIARVVEEHRAN